MSPLPGRVPRRPPWVFDGRPSPDSPFFLLPSAAGVSGNRPFRASDSLPVLYNQGTVQSVRVELSRPYPTGDENNDLFGGWLPGRFAAPGRVVRAPRAVVVMSTLANGAVGVPVGGAMLDQAAPAAAFGAARVSMTLNGFGFSSPLTAWAPVPFLKDYPDTGLFAPQVAPETWVGGDVLVVYCLQGPSELPTADPGWYSVARGYFDRMLARVGRFRGHVLIGSMGDPGGDTSWFAGLPWTVRSVGGGGDQGDFTTAIRDAIAGFFAG